MSNQLLCKICNKECNNTRSLTGHIKKHNLTIKDYYDKFLKKENDGVCVCGKITSFLGLNYGYRKFCSYTCSNNNPESLKKREETCNRKYGCDNVFQNEEIKNKYKKTCKEKYGVDWSMQSKDIQNKSHQTCLKNHGVLIPYQSKEIQKKGEHTCFLKFGVDNHSKTFESRLRARNRLIERIKRNHGSIKPQIGTNEFNFINHLKRYIQNQFYLSEYFYGYYPDIRIEDLKIIIEFDEPEHRSRSWYIKRDKQKDEDYNFLGYKCIRVKEEDWLNDRDKVINEISQLLMKGSNGN